MSIIEKVKRKYNEKGFIGILKALGSKILWKLHILSFTAIPKHIRIMNYLKKNYGYVIERYKRYAPPLVVRITYLNIKM